MFGLLKKASTYTVDQLASMVGWAGFGAWTGERISEETALDTAAVFCAARVIAEGVAQMPLRILEEIDSADDIPRQRVARQHWSHKLLTRRPNSWQTPYEFTEGMTFNAALGPGALAIKVMVGNEVRELLPVPLHAWTVEQDPDYGLIFRVHYADKTHGDFTEDQVLFLRGPSLDGFRALPAVRQARHAIGLSRAMEEQQSKLAANGGKPSGVLSFDNPLKPETQEKLRTTWQSKFGPGGAGGIAIVDGGAKFQSMSMSMVDAQFLESRRFQIEEIARVFRVQPLMLMQADKAATFASAEQMFRMHVVHTLAPWLRRFEHVIARDLLSASPRLRADFDERALLRGDHADQAEYYTKALGAGGQPGWMTPNEVRRERDMNPVNEEWANRIPRGAIEQAPSPRQEDNEGDA